MGYKLYLIAVVLLIIGVMVYANGKVEESIEKERRLAIMTGFTVGMIFQEESNMIQKSFVYNLTNLSDEYNQKYEKRHPGIKQELIKCIEAAREANGTQDFGYYVIPCYDFSYNLTNLAIEDLRKRG